MALQQRAQQRLRPGQRLLDAARGLDLPVPALPFGISYVQLDVGEDHIALRRSDGQIVVCGTVNNGQDWVLPLDPGTSYLQVSAQWYQTVARVGPT